MLPIGIPPSFFKVIKTIFSKYILQNKKPRVNDNLLTGKKKKGGMALPDVGRYYKAIILARLVEWGNINTKKRWVKMED